MSIDLLEQLADADPEKRRKALCQVMLTSESSESICAAIADRLIDNDVSIRELASEVLQNMTCDYPCMVAKLLLGIRDISPIVRANVLRTIQRMTTIPNATRPILAAKLSDTSLLVRISAAHALWKHFHESESLIPIVLVGLSSDHGDTVIRAAQLAAEMTSYGDRLIDQLNRALSHEDALVRGNVLYALARLETDKLRLQELVSRFGGDPDALVKYAIYRILKKAN